MTITKGERDELRRIVRGDFKALTEEIGVRQKELYAEIEKRVATRFMAHEEVIAETDLKVAQVVAEANARIQTVLMECQKQCDGYSLHWLPLISPRLGLVREKRDEMRRAMIADVDARVAHARARMKRQEVELLKRLSVGVLESTDAKAFLTEIPTVAELVPASRLQELEGQFKELGLGTVNEEGPW